MQRLSWEAGRIGALLAGSGGKDFELLCQGWIRIEGVPRPSLAHHVDHFDAGQDNASGDGRLEPEHRPRTALNAPMILPEPIVHILALPDEDRLQPASGAILQAICGVAGNDHLPVSLAPVDDDDALAPVEALQQQERKTTGPAMNSRLINRMPRSAIIFPDRASSNYRPSATARTAGS